jgi:flagellar biogenesis protein FliO
MPGDAMDLAFQLVAVIAVLAGMAIALWFLGRRRAQAAAPSSLSIETRLPLTAQHSLHVIRFAEERLVVATYPGGCSLIRAERQHGEVQ